MPPPDGCCVVTPPEHWQSLHDRARAENRARAERALALGDLLGALGWVGRNDAAQLLRELYLAGRVDDDQLRSVLLGVWSGAEFPCRYLPRWQWLILFEKAGFLSDTGAAAPTEPIELWRAQVGRTMGLSWTRDREQATWFHERNARLGLQGRILHTVAAPRAVLAVIDGADSRGEREVIVQPGRIKVLP